MRQNKKGEQEDRWGEICQCILAFPLLKEKGFFLYKKALQ